MVLARFEVRQSELDQVLDNLLSAGGSLEAISFALETLAAYGEPIDPSKVQLLLQAHVEVCNRKLETINTFLISLKGPRHDHETRSP